MSGILVLQGDPYAVFSDFLSNYFGLELAEIKNYAIWIIAFTLLSWNFFIPRPQVIKKPKKRAAV